MTPGLSGKKKSRCPICARAIVLEDLPTRPFCSERCKLLDLGKWASGRYAIPGPKADPEIEDTDPEDV